jgi:hypothetical protein
MDCAGVRSTCVKRMSLALTSVLLVVACASAPAARASCLGAVVVDGAVLISYGASDWTLPSAAAGTSAVVPACNDGGPKQPDGRTTVVRFVGVPADIAVRSVDGDEVYIVAGSLTALALHPLHRSTRRLARRRCGRKSTLEGVAGSVGFDLIELVAGARSHFYGVDARTVLLNRPAYAPDRGSRPRAGRVAGRARDTSKTRPLSSITSASGERQRLRAASRGVADPLRALHQSPLDAFSHALSHLDGIAAGPAGDARSEIQRAPVHGSGSRTGVMIEPCWTNPPVPCSKIPRLRS